MKLLIDATEAEAVRILHAFRNGESITSLLGFGQDEPEVDGIVDGEYPDGVEVDGAEVDGAEIDGVEVDDVEVDGDFDTGVDVRTGAVEGKRSRVGQKMLNPAESSSSGRA